jgi:hypothetical protein
MGSCPPQPPWFEAGSNYLELQAALAPLERLTLPQFSLHFLNYWRDTSPRRGSHNITLPMEQIGPGSCIYRRVLANLVYHQIRRPVDVGIALRKEEIAVIRDGVHWLKSNHYLDSLTLATD